MREDGRLLEGPGHTALIDGQWLATSCNVSGTPWVEPIETFVR